VQQRGNLVVEREVGVLAERRGPWSRRRGVEQADVPHLDVTQRPARDVQQVVEVEVDHWPSRSRASVSWSVSRRVMAMSRWQHP
jgi:hypothetical protein